MPTTASWELLQKRSFDWPRAKRPRKSFPVNNQRKQIGVGKHVRQYLHNPFTATVTDEPVVHDSDTSIFERGNGCRCNNPFSESSFLLEGYFHLLFSEDLSKRRT